MFRYSSIFLLYFLEAVSTSSSCAIVVLSMESQSFWSDYKRTRFSPSVEGGILPEENIVMRLPKVVRFFLYSTGDF